MVPHYVFVEIRADTTSLLRRIVDDMNIQARAVRRTPLLEGSFRGKHLLLAPVVARHVK